MNEGNTITKVIVTGIDIPFGSLVKLLIKLSIASIPAIIILSGLGLIISLLITFLLYGFW